MLLYFFGVIRISSSGFKLAYFLLKDDIKIEDTCNIITLKIQKINNLYLFTLYYENRFEKV